MRVVVTGGAGFIGANLVARLLEARTPAEIVVLDDLSTGQRANVPDTSAVEFVECSLLDQRGVRVACRGADAIVHLGALPSVPRSIKDPVASHHTNATGTVHVLEAARDIDAYVVVASSSSIYGGNPTLPKHEGLAPRPLSPYAASKLAAEAYTLAYAASFDLEVLAFRFFNVYGPRQAADHAYAAVVPKFVAAALAGDKLVVHGDGEQTRDFTFVESVTAVLADAVEHKVTSADPVNLAFGTRTSILGLIEVMEQLWGRSLPRHHVAARPGDVRDSQADDRALQQLFPNVQPTALVDGIARTIAWFESNPASSGVRN